MGSGDDIQAGRVSTAEGTTDLLGAVPSEKDVDFNGSVILRVGPQPGDLKPNVVLDGIHGIGNNGASIEPGAPPGGTGVIGFGGPNQGTGLVGLGGGVNGNRGGIGVQGIGGTVSSPSFDPKIPPGTGVLDLGGRVDTIGNSRRRPHGAGVVAVAGGSNQPLPLLTETGSVGVYAQGAEARVDTVTTDDIPTIVGPMTPGPGVLGRGGVTIPREGQRIGAGVIGLAGDTAIPPIMETGNTGVYGAGPVGLRGNGLVGPGVLGFGNPGVYGSAVDGTSRGGTFDSMRSAQVRLVPHRLDQILSNRGLVSPIAIEAGSEPDLPKDGLGGDLVAIEMLNENATRECTLWFCIQGEQDNLPARWAQVLLGYSFDGKS